MVPRQPSIQIDNTIRVRHEHIPEPFAIVIHALTAIGGNILSVAIHYIGRTHIYRDITVSVQKEVDVDALVTVVRLLPGVSVEGVIGGVLRLHERGTLVHRGRLHINTEAEMREVYMPGVAKMCRAIRHDPARVRRYTNAGNTVAIVSNGARILGLGDSGPLASLPVMEAKSMFYGQLADPNAVSIVLDVRDVDDFVEPLVRLSSGFAGIHPEDIQSPDCVEIERQLISRPAIPVIHGDQHGTAVGALAAATNLLRGAGRTPCAMVFAQIGLGAAGLAIAGLAKKAGFKGVIGFDWNQAACSTATDCRVQPVSFEECLSHGDVLCLTTGPPGLLKPSRVRLGRIILALSNPLPEIEPAAAMNAGSAGALEGHAINNLLGDPGLFKGAIRSRARRITIPMKFAQHRSWPRATARMKSSEHRDH